MSLNSQHHNSFFYVISTNFSIRVEKRALNKLFYSYTYVYTCIINYKFQIQTVEPLATED